MTPHIVLPADSRSLSLSTTATARVIANFAWQHMRAATTFRDRVEYLESKHSSQAFGSFFEDIRSYGSACIMSSAASLEALINELFIMPEGKLRTHVPNFEVAFWGIGGIERKPPLEKYQIALDMLGKPRFQTVESPFRDAWALMELRNALVHFKPIWDEARQRTVEMVDVLSGKYCLSPFPDSGSDFVTMRSMSADCMRWAVNTSLKFMHEFHMRAPLDEKKMSGFWRLSSQQLS